MTPTLGDDDYRRLLELRSGLRRFLRWSEHAAGNAIDIAAFVTEDGRRISVLGDWQDAAADGRFLRRVRDDACSAFGTVLSPDYNEAHRDHLHLDQQSRGLRAVCR